MLYKFSEKEVVVKGEYDLSATLTIPELNSQKLPAVVIIGGTGKGDRDGNMKNFNMNIYRQLAEYLSGLGLITIRYDKRGIGKSKGDFNKTGVHDLVKDIISNINYLENLSNVDKDKILLLGHSEGCILASIANTTHPVSGLILVSGAGICLKTAMQFQNLGIIEEIKKMKGLKGKLLSYLVTEKKVVLKQKKLFDLVSASNEDVLRIQFQKFPAKWLREHLSYTDDDVLDMLNKATCPILVIAGDKDVQADSEDLEMIKALQKQTISCRTIENMDHVLREYSGEKTVINVKKQYKHELNKPLHDKLKEEIKHWYGDNFGELVFK